MTQTLEQLSAAATELLPCPFCASAEHLIVSPCGSMTADMPARPHRVVCNHLDCEYVQGPVGYGKYDAITRWNTRTGQLVAVQPDDATVKRVARLVNEYCETMDRDVLHSWAKDVVAAMPSQAALQAEIDRLRIELQNIAETTDDEVTSRQAFIALSKGPKP